jgi:hypothetical protein
LGENYFWRFLVNNLVNTTQQQTKQFTLVKQLVHFLTILVELHTHERNKLTTYFGSEKVK